MKRKNTFLESFYEFLQQDIKNKQQSDVQK